MQTFLPLANFIESAKVLDYRRLGKQRVEAFQLLLAMGNSWALTEREWRINQGLMQDNPLGKGWSNHPATNMWYSNQEALKLYYNVVVEEWCSRGYNNTMRFAPINKTTFPAWLGREDFHASHRSNLLRKDFTYYSQFGWQESNDLKYVWPRSRNFRIW